MNGSELDDIGGSIGGRDTVGGDVPRTDTAHLPELEELQLPAPALATPPVPRPAVPATLPISNANRRAFALTSPRIIPSSPRARFAIPGSPSTLLGMPLRPIIHSPTPLLPDHGPEEADIADADVFRLDAAPMFAPRDDDEPHPEKPLHEQPRTPHPLYTPVTPRGLRRRRRASRSVASSRTNKTTRSAKSTLRAVWRTVRRQPKRAATDGGRSASGSSDSSSTSSSSRSSGRSSSTWGGWRFWRNSSSGSSSSGSSDTEDEWEPPTPHFTLLTPCLTRKAPLAYPPHLVPGARRTNATPASPTSASVFDLSTSTTLAPAIERLHAFWSELRQEDGVAGDLGAGAATATARPAEDAASYFGMANNQASTSSTPTATPAVTPGVGSAPGGRKLKGEAKAAVAEEKRLGTGTGEERPAWWLDVMCPTVADMRELRKILPLHPLTMEDILHQETREKIESFPTLGYYFIVFRALDESYFRYTSPDGPADEAVNQRQNAGLSGKRKQGRVDIIEGVGGKEGLEGVSVGAVNLYLIVFGDGIISFHFEDISKHAERVQGKIQQLGLSRTMSSHWIAYGLMDSIVDTFFPLIDFIEGETSEVEAFVSDPLGSSLSQREAPASSTSSSYNDEVVGIIVERPPSDDTKNLSDESFDSKATLKIKRSTTRSVLASLPSLTMPAAVLSILPKTWTTSKTTTTESTEMVDVSRFKSFRALRVPFSKKPKTLEYDLNHRRFNKMLMLRRIAGTRKLVTGLSRLLGAKSDVVRGLQKRSVTDNLGSVKRADAGQDIALYFDDLFDHIIAMQQSLAFYEAILSHDHPAFLGILRLALLRAKAGTDRALVGLYIVGLIVLPANILVGLFSLNVQVPHNGSRYDHVLDDGSPAGYQLFGVLWAGVSVVAAIVLTFAWFLFKQVRLRKAIRRGDS